MPDNSIGALWKRKGTKGEFLAGNITINNETFDIVCFPNDYKKTEKHPDYKILPSRPKNAPEAQAPPPTDGEAMPF